MAFLWFKALHLIAMVTWFAALFYLPRLFVYHALADDTISIARFKLMERKLFYGIATPGGVLTLIFGMGMLLYADVSYQGQWWLYIKLILVLLLIIYHVYCGLILNVFKQDKNKRTHIWYRWFNELPVLLLFAIVILAVLRPV